jgi:putative transcriptional regulator
MLFFKRKPAFSNAHDLSAVHQSEGFLQDQLLVSTPAITGSCFQRSVIYLFAHNEEGAMGIIINQPMEIVDYASLLSEDETPLLGDCKEEVSVYFGGPVDRSRGFVIHSNDYRGGEPLFTGTHVSVSANSNILKHMAAGVGPAKTLLCVGYAGWSAGQLEKELEENSWITVPATPELIFNIEDDMKWGMASQSLGIDMNFFSPIAGHA